jgi:hypothetical protein
VLRAQDGGDIRRGHRCVGEGVTVAMLRVGIQRLAGQPGLVIAQDLRYDHARVPAGPAGGARLAPRDPATGCSERWGTSTPGRTSALPASIVLGQSLFHLQAIEAPGEAGITG